MFKKGLRHRNGNGGGSGGKGGAARAATRARVESALRQDRLAVSGEGLGELRRDLLTVISGHLPVAAEFEEFGLYQDAEDGEVYLTARVRVERRGR